MVRVANRCYDIYTAYTHCARRPPCVIVIMILSEKHVEVISVSVPSMVPAACLVMAG